MMTWILVIAVYLIGVAVSVVLIAYMNKIADGKDISPFASILSWAFLAGFVLIVVFGALILVFYERCYDYFGKEAGDEEDHV